MPGEMPFRGTVEVKIPVPLMFMGLLCLQHLS